MLWKRFVSTFIWGRFLGNPHEAIWNNTDLCILFNTFFLSMNNPFRKSERLLASSMQWRLCHKLLIVAYLRSFSKFPIARTERFRCKTSIHISLFLNFSFCIFLLEPRKFENCSNKISMLHFTFSKSAIQKTLAFIYKYV